LPVNQLAADNSILFLWSTFPKIQEALNTINAWGFNYKTIAFCWIKRNKNGTWFKGIGFYSKSNCEVCLIGTKGKAPKVSVHHSISQIIETVRECHSKKPDIVRDKIVEFSGDIPRIELFARQETNGQSVGGGA
jgi:site-specific DNA-methyltransferase (adenine-specific)